MKIQPYQIALLVISSVMVFQGIKNFVKRETGQTFLKLGIRLLVWGGMAAIAIYPDITWVVARALGIVDNINAAIMIGFLLIFLMIFKLLSAIEKIEQNISELTRRDALHDIDVKIDKLELDEGDEREPR
jgi:hypothetical protein